MQYKIKEENKIVDGRQKQIKEQEIKDFSNPSRLTNGSLKSLELRLHVTETKSHPRMKKFLFTREFNPGVKRVEFHPGMKFNLKEPPIEYENT